MKMFALWDHFFLSSSPGVGFTKQIFIHSVIFLICQHCQSTRQILNYRLIFDRYRHSSAAVTPFKYQSDSKNPTVAFARSKISKILLTEKLTNGTLVIVVVLRVCKYMHSFHWRGIGYYMVATFLWAKGKSIISALSNLQVCPDIFV